VGISDDSIGIVTKFSTVVMAEDILKMNNTGSDSVSDEKPIANLSL
jgi:hypothetical protein